MITMEQKAYGAVIKNINEYNRNINNPKYLLSILKSKTDRKFTAHFIKKNRIKKLLKINQTGNNVWQIKTKKAIIDFNIASIYNGIIHINHKKFNLTVHSSVEEMANEANKIINNHQLKKSSFLNLLKELIFQNANAAGGITTTTALIIAGVIGLFATGIVITKNRSNSKKSKGKKNNTANTPTPQKNNIPFSITPVGPSQDEGFFSLKSFNGKLYAGAFGYAGKQMIFVYENEKLSPVSPGFTVKESVCAFEEFKGQLYANTESSGKLLRSKDGNNWQEVFDGPNELGCGLAKHGDYLYALNANYNKPPGHIYRSSDGGSGSWTKVYDSGSTLAYIREIITYKNTIYVFGSDKDHNNFLLSSTNGDNWSKSSAPDRMLRGHVFDGKLWLVSAGQASTGKGKGRVWTFDGSNFSKIYESNHTYMGDIIDINGTLAAVTTVKWKGSQGGATLVASCDNGTSWKTVHTFKETEAWALEKFNNEIFVGTKHQGGGAQVYKATGLCSNTNTFSNESNETNESNEANEKSCSEVEGFVWKMNKDGNLGVVIGKSYKGCDITVEGQSPNIPCGELSSGQTCFRYGGHPTQFESPAKVKILCQDKETTTVNIPDTGKRCSFHPGGWGD